MMKKCPKCNKWMVAFDGYRKVTKCHNDACSAHIYEDSSYSHLRGTSGGNVVERVRIFPDGREKVMKKISLL